MMKGALSFVCVLALVLLPPFGAQAQSPADTSRSSSSPDPSPRVTLDGWMENHRLLVLDRRHNRGDRFYDRGLFRHVTPRKDREYAMDMFAQRFTWEEMGHRALAPNSLHLRAGSVRRDLFAFISRLQSTVQVAADHTITIDGVIQQDAEALRPFFELGYGWQVASNHTVGVRHTFSEYKPDLDVTAFYRFGHSQVGRAEVGVTLQNLYSDLIDQHLSIPPQFRDVIRSYSRRPYLLSVSYTSPRDWPIRGEIGGALQPWSRATYASQTDEAFEYQDERRLWFVSGLVEYHRGSFSGGVYFKGDMSRLDRTGTGQQVSSRYGAKQRFWRFGLFVADQWGPLDGSIRGFTGGYGDRQWGQSFAQSLIPDRLDYGEAQWGVRSRLRYRWSAGPYAGLGYDALRRTYEGVFDLNPVDNPVRLASWAHQWQGPGAPGPSNHRLVTLAGYDFSRGRIEVGFGIDLDGDNTHPGKTTPKRFDNGFGRFILTW